MRAQERALTVLMAAVTLNLRLCSCFLFKVFFRFGKSRLFTLNAVYGQLCFLCVAKTACWTAKTAGTTPKKRARFWTPKPNQKETAAAREKQSANRRQKIHPSGFLKAGTVDLCAFIRNGENDNRRKGPPGGRLCGI